MKTIEQLRLVEIELFSYCNRKCNWCPNHYIDRQSEKKYLDVYILCSLLYELKKNNFHGRISFSRYNEPFSDFDHLQQVCMIIKQFLPNITLVSNTNGDYITEEIIKTMYIDELTIMDYDGKGRDYVLNKLRSWNLKCIQEYNHYFVATHGKKKILYYYSWLEDAKISDRGGNLKEYSLQKRDYPCYEPLYFIGVNYDGTVSPCCNIRNDCENQKDYILGDLHNSSLEDLMKSDFYLDFIDAVTACNFTDFMPCYYCNNNGGRYTREDGGIHYGK